MGYVQVNQRTSLQQYSRNMALLASREDALKVINHIFLPPQLPQKDEPCEGLILKVVADALFAFPKCVPSETSTAIRNAVTLLSNVKAVHSKPDGEVSETDLHRILTNLQPGQVMAVNVSAQNAAVVITREQDQFIFEQFELSPQNKAVVSTLGRLVRTFPEKAVTDTAVAVSAALLRESEFAKELSKMLTTMCSQTVPEMQPQTRKAGTKHAEIRDSADPFIVSKLLFGMLKGIGTSRSSSIISKNTREEVLWKKALLPWRRSPMWLMIRVNLQLVISRSEDGSHTLYKKVMLFIMSRILNSAQRFCLPSDLIYVMNAKMDRRRQKLAALVTPQDPIMTCIADVLRKCNDDVSARWTKLQTNDTRNVDMQNLGALEFEEDMHVAIPALDRYVQAITSRQSSTDVSHFKPSTGFLKHDSREMPPLPTNMSNVYALSNLQQFEEWVVEHLDRWVTERNSNEACEQLRKAIKEYHSVARQLYDNNPEGISIMLLTIMELWIACDMAAVRGCNLLADYDPGIASEAMQNLLLPFASQMERLSKVEKHLASRWRKSTLKWSFLFDTLSPDSFANRFYKKSRTHQLLFEKISSEANRRRQAKLEELERTQSEYRRLDTLCNRANCEYITRIVDDWCDPPETETEHSRSCQKCKHQRERDDLSITVFEWPLPESRVKAQVVVFELEVPPWFSQWRDARFYVLNEVLGGTREPKDLRANYSLSSNDPHLTTDYFRSQRNRIGLLSENKPVINTHYRGKKMSGSSEETICVRNGMDYRYFDSATTSYVSDFLFNNKTPLSCTYKLSDKSKALERFLFRPASIPDGEPPNEVIASQNACPPHLSLAEYKELSHLPLGHSIQWSNIITQLAMPGVDFKKDETTYFFLQCIYQAGPPSKDGNILREAHCMLLDDDIALSVVENLRLALERVKKNWESSQALNTFVAIATRILSINRATKHACSTFLKAARDVAVDWMQALRDKAFSVAAHADRTEFILKGIEVALICASTFNVDNEHLAEVLRSPEDASILVRASIIVQEGQHAQANTRSHVALLDFRFRRLLYRSYKMLASNPAGLDIAIKMAWSAYLPGDEGWIQASGNAGHWMTTRTAICEGASAKQVHYDLLTGELLVNGLPIDQPPAAYRSQPLFRTLFGQAVVEVMPASRSGFEFSTQRQFGGSQVQIGMNNGSLIVQTTNSGRTFETLPHSMLQGVYPQHFVNDYVLWYSASTNVVELRPIEDPWNSESTLKWTLSKPGKSRPWTLTKNGVHLLGLKCETAETLGHILQPLASLERIHCLLQPNSALLQVEIPSLQLAFSLAEKCSDLKSREYRSMVVDQNQSLGTLIGFSNKLMLKSKTSNDRLAMILEGDVTLTRQDDHVSARILSYETSKVHAVEVDNALHRFKDSGDLDCKLYLAYLHAITSFCLPDPLTLRTGTEEALTILESKAVESFAQLSQASVDLLTNIASLSPGRCYYPAQERVMQQVNWRSDLSVLSQHGRFSTVVSNLFEQARLATIFFPEQALQLPSLGNIEKDLRTRDNIRSSVFKVFNFGAEDHNTEHDKPYSAAHRQGSSNKSRSLSQRAENVANMAQLILSDNKYTVYWAAFSTDDLWELMHAESCIHGARAPIASSDMRYDANHLQNGLRSAVSQFPALHRWLHGQQGSGQHRFAIMTWLAAMAFAEGADMSILQAFAMSYKCPDLAGINAPDAGSFTPRDGRVCSEKGLRNIVSAHQRKYENCPEYNLPRNKNEKAKAYSSRRHNAWQRSSQATISRVVSLLTTQWRCETPTTPEIAEASTYINMDKAMTAARNQFKIWYNNSLLYEYIDEVQQSIDRLPIIRPSQLPASGSRLAVARQSPPGYVSEDDLFSGSAPISLADVPALVLPEQHKGTAAEPTTTPRLASLIEELRSTSSPSTYERNYIKRLEESLVALVSGIQTAPSTVRGFENVLATYADQCKIYNGRLYDDLVAAMCSSAKSQMAHETHRLPRISPMFLLRQLAHDRWSKLSTEWQTCIVKYGRSWVALQRAWRLESLAKESRTDELISELTNIAHANWDPLEHPEWLLIEAESGIIIRAKQVQIAGQMQNPDANTNAVMQLNMGEGKSSVIVPIIAAALADGSQLVRVIIAKPQSKQMAQMMTSKLGGLVNRGVYYMPFSRSLKLTRTSAEAISDMLRKCMRDGGILLVQPEHLLSFKLMALECFINDRSDVGERVASTQEFLDRSSRDVVDEADENFSTRFELIYTIGLQTAVEMSPDRWLLLQQVLHLASQYAADIQNECQSSVEITSGTSGSFPRIRLLCEDAGNDLVKKIANHVIDHGLDGFRLNRQTPDVCKAVYTYITKPRLDPQEISAVEDGQMWTDATRSHLLMLRGILAGGVLGFALGQKRYRVNYGLTTRTPPTKLAVPYRAKDSPALRSEFSHPDVVILLTHLSYYYQGLNDEDLFAAFGHLMNSDQADTEYEAWVIGSHTLPAALRQLQGINLKDRAQCIEELFPHLRNNKSVVDYFLSHLVLPKEMKEFPHKLSASGWDIGKQRKLLTTAFSGTVDSHPLLPLSMKYRNLPEQLHTNALVLEYLLQPENEVHLMANTGSTSDAEHLLSSIMRLNPTPQVILDLGAQVLELSNLEMAKTWLGLSDSSKEAVIFVDDSDEICIVDRNDRITTWQNSSYQSRPDACLVFLDEAHTRGTDLKLPKDYRAAVTLGARVTKDRLVQACMRMRKLGKGQSVVFCISKEIQTKIRDATTKPSPTSIEVGDVLVWSILESHSEIRRSMPLWATQGERFIRQEKLWKAARSHSGELILTKDYANDFLEKEGQTIEDRYRPRQSLKYLSHLSNTTNAELEQIGSRCREFDDLQFDSSTLHEEQERELSPEIEQERQIERARAAKSAKHSLHPHVEQFAMEGRLIPCSEAYQPAFLTLQQLRAWKLLAKNQFGNEGDLLATADFATTVEKKGTSFISDEFVRPVHWVLARCARGSNEVDCIMIISQYEANQLQGKMIKTCGTTLHVYKPRVNSSYGALDTLNFHFAPVRSNVPSVPRSLAVQLNLFAGQLYISSYKDYEEICKVLGLLPKKVTEEMEKRGWKVQADGFILSDDKGRVGGESKLKKSPVAFLKALMSIRRNGDDISKTQMGGLLEGKLFEASDFDT